MEIHVSVENVSAENRFASSLGFTPEDLAANRDGALTDSQRERLHHLQRLEFTSSALLAPIFILFPVAVVIALLYFLLRPTYDGLEWMWVILLVGVVFNIARFMPAGLRRWRAVQADIDAGSAAAAEGRTAIKVVPVKRAKAYLLRVGKVEFPVPESMAAAFQEGERIRVYYTPDALILLSAEDAG